MARGHLMDDITPRDACTREWRLFHSVKVGSSKMRVFSPVLRFAYSSVDDVDS